jgi:hypothetical protein
MISKTTKAHEAGWQDAFASVVSFAAIVMVSVCEIASSFIRGASPPEPPYTKAGAAARSRIASSQAAGGYRRQRQTSNHWPDVSRA